MEKLNLGARVESLRRQSGQPAEFPSELHEVAWEIAQYLNEGYAFWVRLLMRTAWWPARVRHELEVLRGKRQFTVRQKARMLAATLAQKPKKAR